MGSMLDHRVVYIMCVVMFVLLQAAFRVGSTLDHRVVYIMCVVMFCVITGGIPCGLHVRSSCGIYNVYCDILCFYRRHSVWAQH